MMPGSHDTSQGTDKQESHSSTIPKGKSLNRSPPQSYRPQPPITGQTSQTTTFSSPMNMDSTASNKRTATSPLENDSAKKMDVLTKTPITLSDSENEPEDLDINHDSQDITEEFSQSFDRAVDILSAMERLQSIVTSIVRSKKTPTATQTRQLSEFTDDVKSRVLTLQAKHLQLQGMYTEQSRQLAKFPQRGASSSQDIRQEIRKEFENLRATIQPFPVTRGSYASVTERGLKEQHPAPPTKVLLVYPKEDNSGKTSDETKIELQTVLQPQQLRLRINRFSRIRNGGMAIEVPESQETELKERLQENFRTKSPKVNRPKFKIFDIPAPLSAEQVSETIYSQIFSEVMPVEDFKANFIPLFKTGPKDHQVTQWIVEIGKEVRVHIPSNNRIYLEWQACKIKPYTIVSRCFKCQRYGHVAKACAAESPTCGHCAAEGHLFKDCPQKEWNYKCSNCIRTKSKNHNHDVSSSTCPIYKIELERATRMINYDS